MKIKSDLHIIGTVGINTLTYASTGQVEIQSSSTGVILPRLTTATRLAIANPSAGLLVYDIDLNQYMYWNGTTWITLGDITYTNLSPTEISVGGVSIGMIFNNQTMKQMWDTLLYPELFPTLTNPSHTFTLEQEGLQEVGAQIDLEFNATFDRGLIDPAYGTSGFRSGLPNAYEYVGTGLPSSVPKTDLTDTQTVISYLVVEDVQSWQCRVAYDGGEQPLSNKGNPYDSPLPAGTTSYITRSITGVYPWFATTESISSTSKQPLEQHNAQYFQASMVGETDTEKQKAEFSFRHGAITGVQFFNTISGQWEWIGGSKSASLLYWNMTSFQRNINGTDITYYRYTHTGPKVGPRQLRFYTI